MQPQHASAGHVPGWALAGAGHSASAAAAAQQRQWAARITVTACAMQTLPSRAPPGPDPLLRGNGIRFLHRWVRRCQGIGPGSQSPSFCRQAPFPRVVAVYPAPEA